jgi:DNA-binding XRE family transcriptional regulator
MNKTGAKMNNLKQIRKDLGLSGAELARLSGKSKSYIWEVEKGSYCPSLNTAYAVANVLGKTVYDIWPDKTEVEETTVRRVKK